MNGALNGYCWRDTVNCRALVSISRRSGAVLAVLCLGALACAPAAPGASRAAAPAPAASGAATSSTASTAPYADIVQKAAQEHQVIIQMSEPVDMSLPEAARTVAAGVKQQFGVDLDIKFDNSISYNAAGAKVVSEVKAGSPPSFDLMYQTSVTGIAVYNADAIQPIEWTRLFDWITDKDLDYDGLVLIPSTMFYLPAYNTDLVKGADIPHTWNDLLNPKWKGKIGSTIYQDPWAHLAEPAGWGEERTADYLRRLAALDPVLGRFPEVQQRLESGEIAIAAVAQSFRIDTAKAAGAPVAVVVAEPIILAENISFVTKGAPHANAATLVNAWFLTDDGQRFMDKAYPTASAFRPGSAAAKFVEGKQYVRPTDFQIKNTTRVQKEFEEIIVKR